MNATDTMSFTVWTEGTDVPEGTVVITEQYMEDEADNPAMFLGKAEAWAKATSLNPKAIKVVFQNGTTKVFHPEITIEPKGVVLTEGRFYADSEGSIYRVRTSNRNGHLYAEVFEGERWVYAKGAVYHTEDWHNLTAEEAAAFGHETHKCVFCHRALSTKESTAVGYGPICAEKHGLPWGE